MRAKDESGYRWVAGRIQRWRRSRSGPLSSLWPAHHLSGSPVSGTAPGRVFLSSPTVTKILDTLLSGPYLDSTMRDETGDTERETMSLHHATVAATARRAIRTGRGQHTKFNADAHRIAEKIEDLTGEPASIEPDELNRDRHDAGGWVVYANDLEAVR